MTTFQWLSIILVICGGLWKLNRTLCKIEIALTNKVSFSDCADRQEKCPCIKDIEHLKKDMEFLHPRKKGD